MSAPVKDFNRLPVSSINSWQRQPTSRPTYQTKANHSSWDAYFKTDGKDPIQRRIVLTRQFRYRTAPWMEAGDPDGAFGVSMMQMAQDYEPLQSLVAELASCQLFSHFDDSVLSETTRQLTDVDAPVKLVGEAIICLIKNLCCRPSLWKSLHFKPGPNLSATASSVYDLTEPLQTLVRQQSRLGTRAHIPILALFFLILHVDLAASILTSVRPATCASFYLPQDLPASVNNSALRASYDWALHNLTQCLHYIFSPSIASPESAFSSPGSPEVFSVNAANTSWHTLWVGCQPWYDSRPLEMQRLVDVGSLEMSQIDPSNLASFPIQLYTNAAAVQAAIFYHITALLLLEHKPRLLSIPGRRHHFTSRSWHVRAIAGIATSNTFPEQWDPIVIASLLYTARDITHVAQQDALLGCFQEISNHTGIPLDDEIEKLQAHWAAACLVESSLLR